MRVALGRTSAVACLLVGALVSAHAAVAVAATAAGPPVPTGNVEPALDAANGKVAVVAAGAPVDGKIAVIVQNGKTEPVRSVKVTAVATSADGSRSTKVSTRSLIPSTLEPGAIALTALGFDAADVDPDSAITYRVSSGRAGSGGDRAALAIGSLALSAPLAGDVAQTLDLSMTNPTSRTIRGPISVRVMCFGEARRPTGAVDGRIARTKLAAGATVSATVKLRELCPSYLVAAKGRSAG